MARIDSSRSTATPSDLTLRILGLAAACEGLADLVAAAYIALLPDRIARVLIRKFPLPSADLVALIRAAAEREGYEDMSDLPGEYDRLAQVRNDLAHLDQHRVDLDQPEPVRLFSHRGRAPAVLAETLTLDDLRREVDRAFELRSRMTGLAYRLGYFRIRDVGKSPNPLPERGPGPRPVRRDSEGRDIG